MVALLLLSLAGTAPSPALAAPGEDALAAGVEATLVAAAGGANEI